MWDNDEEYYTFYNAYIENYELQNHEQEFANAPVQMQINPNPSRIEREPEKIERFEGSTIVSCLKCGEEIMEDHFDFHYWRWLCE